MQNLISILVFLVSILLLITVHEFGHFWVARRLGVKVLRFSLGFGKPIFRRQGRHGTEYVICILPLGGYVKLLDEREGTVKPQELHQAFNRQPLWKRALIVVAGPAINLLFALVAFFTIWVIGVEQVKPVIGEVIPQTVAAQSGIPAGAEIVAVDGQPVGSWQKMAILLVSWFGDTGTLLVQAIPPGADKARTYSMQLKKWQPNNGLEPDPFKSLGIVPYRPPIPLVIEKVMSESPAEQAGLQKGDRIVAVDQQPYQDWQPLKKFVNQHPNQTIQVTYMRGEKTQEAQVSLQSRYGKLFHRVGYLGIEPKEPIWPPGMRYTKQLSPIAAMGQAFSDVGMYLRFNFVVIGKMIVGNISMRSLGGPVSIFQTSSLAFHQGLVIYIAFLGLLSVLLAGMNILPIPGLDGGHLLFFMMEGIAGRPVSARLQLLLLKLGILFLLMILFQATVNDIIRLVN